MKRKDSKGRVLRDGELQRKDGKYEYRYYDVRRQRHSVYSWKLVETDAAPRGTRKGPALRTLEQDIAKALMLEVGYHDTDSTTINDYTERMLALKSYVKPTTKILLEGVYRNHIANGIGFLPIKKLRYEDVRIFYTTLLQSKQLSISTVANVDRVLRPTLDLAVRNHVILTNPAAGVLLDIKREMRWTQPKRHALTIAQQGALLDFLGHTKEYQKWLPLVTVLLGTGMRIGEALALRWDDCDFEGKMITVQHGYVRIVDADGHIVPLISTPKTQAGIRKIPMLDGVSQALIALRIDAMRNGYCMTKIGEYEGFIFQNTKHRLLDINYVERVLHRIAARYNEREMEAAVSEHRLPVLLPDLTAHVLRHTFCTRVCENESNIKVVQEVMGHANITTTMNVYNEATIDKKVEVFQQLEGKIRIS